MPSELLILESLDGCGKTTAAKHIARERGSRTAILHAGPPIELSGKSEYLTPIRGLATAGYTVICDRWLLGELVWSHVYGRRPLFDVGEMQAIEAELVAAFSSVRAVFLNRPIADILGVRKLDYDPAFALALYSDAMECSTLNWETMDMFEASKL